MTKTERIENIVKKLKTRQSKAIIYTILIVVVASLFAFRFYAVNQEGKTEVFNIIRNNIDNGTPVEVLKAEKINGVLYEPLTIKNNRAYISGARLDVFKVGQKTGNCKIVSVSKKIDLDSGMYIVKTSGCKDGLQYIEKEKIGFYVPVSAIKNNAVYVVNSGVAQIHKIVIEDMDSQNALIKTGINNGDIVILSNVKESEKVKI